MLFWGMVGGYTHVTKYECGAEMVVPCIKYPYVEKTDNMGEQRTTIQVTAAIILILSVLSLVKIDAFDKNNTSDKKLKK